jgi:hypothetical protein
MELVVSWAVPVNSSATSVSFDDIVSTPSLGITATISTFEPKVCRLAFNSLSRDHRRGNLAPSTIRSWTALITFNSLSRDHQESYLHPQLAEGEHAFNSLSRDHITVTPRRLVARGEELSTPSLGITAVRGPRSARRIPCSGFQLPLSGSPHVIDVRGVDLDLVHFQLPLSGSLAENEIPAHPTMGHLSTPSLGITIPGEDILYHAALLSTPSLGITRGAMQVVRYDQIEQSFNSLSRDHRARFRDFSAFRGFLPRHLFAQMISKATIWIYRFAPL